MDIMNLDLFPVPVTVLNLGEKSRQLNLEIMEAIKVEKKQHHNQKRSGVNVWQSHSKLEDRHDIFKKLQTTFFNHFRPYMQRAGYTNCVLDDNFIAEDFWVNYNNSPHAYHMPHIHGDGKTLFSAVYFPTSGFLNGVPISKNENLDEPVMIAAKSQPDPGSLVLLDPSYAIKNQVYDSRFLNRYPYYGMEISITPREGVLVMFPQYLTHLVTPTEQQGFERYSIAFDINKK